MCSIEATKQTPENKIRKLRHTSPILLALIIGAALLISFGIYSSMARNISNTELCGNWVGPTGKTMTIRPDGTALSGGTRNYNWSIEDDIITFESIPNKRSLKWLARKAAEGIASALTNDKAGQRFRIIKSSYETFTILELGNDTPLTLKRIDNLNLQKQKTVSKLP